MDDSMLPADRSVIKGICGNHNGNPEDDMMTMTGKLATSTAAIGNSYALTEVAGPVSKTKNNINFNH